MSLVYYMIIFNEKSIIHSTLMKTPIFFNINEYSLSTLYSSGNIQYPYLYYFKIHIIYI